MLRFTSHNFTASCDAVRNNDSQNHVSHEKKTTYYVPLYWLVYRDPYIGLLKSPYNWVV